MRCGKSCRLRWINYLRPDVKRGNFTKEEEDIIISLHQSIGNKWSRIAAHLPGRTDNEIKNVWNTYLKKRISSPLIDTSSATTATATATVSASPSQSQSSSSSSPPFVDKADAPMTQSVIIPAMVVQPLPPPAQAQDESLKQDLSTSTGSHEYGSGCSFDQSFNDPDPGDSLFGLLGPSALEEVDKPNCFAENNGMEMEVPLEFDYDFWNLLESLEPMRPQLEGMEACGGGVGVGMWGEEMEAQGEVAAENRNWLRRLERELGLEVSDHSGDDRIIPSDNL